MRVGDDFYYLDVLVSCDTKAAISYYAVSPLMIIEVPSTSTAARDRFEKRLASQRLDSLQEYVLVEQEEVEVEVIRRVPDGWESERYGSGETLQFH